MVRPLLLSLLLTSCTFVSENYNVMVASEPPGAEILLDGLPTGRTTPAMLSMEDESSSTHVLTLRKSGFEDESRTIYHYKEWYTSRWDDGAIGTTLVNWPIWWTLGDMFTPFAVRYLFVPHDLLVRLYPDGEAPARSETIRGVDPLTGTHAPVKW